MLLPRDPRWRLGETDRWVIALNEDQGLIGRAYLALKRPETDVAALTDGEIADLWAGVRRVKAALDTLFAPDHYNFAFLMNVDPQVHFHVIPRYAAPRAFADRSFSDPEFGGHYPVAPPHRLDDATYDTLISTLRTAL